MSVRTAPTVTTRDQTLLPVDDRSDAVSLGTSTAPRPPPAPSSRPGTLGLPLPARLSRRPPTTPSRGRLQSPPNHAVRLITRYLFQCGIFYNLLLLLLDTTTTTTTTTTTVADPGFAKGGTNHGERAERETKVGSGGGSPSGAQGQRPWWGVRGAKPPEAESFLSIFIQNSG